MSFVLVFSFSIAVCGGVWECLSSFVAARAFFVMKLISDASSYVHLRASFCLMSCVDRIHYGSFYFLATMGLRALEYADGKILMTCVRSLWISMLFGRVVSCDRRCLEV